MSSPYPLRSPAADAPIRVALTCRACKKKARIEVPSVTVDPHACGWDGIYLQRVFECGNCHAVDDYAIEAQSLCFLRMRAVAVTLGGLDERVRVGTPTLSDGVPIRRPSEAIAYARNAVSARPSAETWRKLGNVLSKYDAGDAAEAWTKAVELDPDEAEAALSLARRVIGDLGPDDAYETLAACVSRWPRAKGMTAATRAQLGEIVAEMLLDWIDGTAEPTILEAAWPEEDACGDSLVRLSSVDLRRVRDWSALGRFLARADLVVLRLRREAMADDAETHLEALLNFDALPAFFVSAPAPSRSTPRPCQ